MPHERQWRKTSFSPGDHCVEMAGAGDRVAIRNSNHPDAGTILVTRPALAGLLDRVKAGEFDAPS